MLCNRTLCFQEELFTDTASFFVPFLEKEIICLSIVSLSLGRYTNGT